jgi:PAS domain S-box-containing protein
LEHRYLFPFNIVTDFKNGKRFFQKIKNFWEWLITPSVLMPQPDLLRQSRLLAAMLAVLVTLGLLLEILTIEFARNQGEADHGLTFLIILILGLAFLLNRAGRLAAAAWITVAVLSIAIYVLTFFTNSQPVDVDFLNFLFLPLLFASVFMPKRMIPVLAFLFMGAISVSGFLPGNDPVQVILGPGAFVFVASGIIYLINHHRNDLELDRQQTLMEKEERYRTLLETTYEGICIISDGKILDANPNFARMFGYELTELVGQPVMKLVPVEFHPGILSALQTMNGHPSRVPVYRKDGSAFHIETVSRMQTYLGQPAQVIAIRDITERVQAEEALDRNERLYRSLFEGANDAIFLLSFSDTHIAANQKAADMLGYSVQELVGKAVNEVVVDRDYLDVLRKKNGLLSGETFSLSESTFRKKDGAEFPVEVNVSLVYGRDGEPLFIQSIVRDITERKRAESRIQRQLKRLKGLREIDRMINGSLDLRRTLDVLLDQVADQLGADAAAILLFNPSFHQLETAARRGLPADTVLLQPVRLNGPLAGRAALEGRLVYIQDLISATENCLQLEHLAESGFKAGIAVPLIAKGQIKGVLEVFQRQPFDTSPEWFEHLETLGGQAAIAIDNAELFRNLQRSNLDLIRSYDVTLEGFAKALELRDKETDGHSQRVTEMTLQLGQALGVNDADLVHLRRGAILHDIGKMGIPDAILFKPGPLTDAEWEVMKYHPVYAWEMLSPISFLSHSLDIPYCHHEKWDGSGYPRGLKGLEIPLAARIFAVVDVWDALTSNRPYREAWTPEKTREYISEQSGKHFDPQVVAAFLSLQSILLINDRVRSPHQ